MPSLVQLEYALAIDKYRHFGNAAKNCHITQPTLSMQLQKLEDEVGLIIFDRGHKPIIPTPEGEIFLKQAQVVLRENLKLLEISKTHAEEISGTFRLGIIPTVANYLLPLWIGHLIEKFPKIDLFIEELTTDQLIEKILRDDIDGAILATPLHQEGLKEHPLYYEEFFTYLPLNHPLLRKKQLSPKDLEASNLWMLKDGHCFKTQVSELCRLNKKKFHLEGHQNIHFQSGSLEALKNLVLQGHGLTLIPFLMTYFMSKDELKHHVRPFTSPAPVREISLVYRRDHWKLRLLNALEQTILEIVPPQLKSKKGKEVVEFVT